MSTAERIYHLAAGRMMADLNVGPQHLVYVREHDPDLFAEYIYAAAIDVGEGGSV